MQLSSLSLDPSGLVTTHVPSALIQSKVPWWHHVGYFLAAEAYRVRYTVFKTVLTMKLNCS